MPIDYDGDLASFREVASGDEAEQLLGWLQGKPEAQLDLRDCTHIHPATLQVLLASGADIVAWPQDASLRAWLEPLRPVGPRSSPDAGPANSI